MALTSPGRVALRKGRVALPHAIYLITTTTLRRQPIFTHFAAGCAAARCFEDRALLHGCSMLAWVLMPDHAHWLLQLGTEPNLEATVNRLKSASARLANRATGRRGALWTAGFHDRALRHEDDLRKAARYLVANPLRAGLATRVGDYPFWNAIWI
ncbi:transposase [Pseudomonas sp. 21]|uniref:REP-associated tyrosine transposase n=1 Tax=unclassified Pseudomonas TaxID=196821 RepID=UPI0005EB4FA7|nr:MULTISPECIES: transposase [unclassified Pseudomonas]KJK02019.1 transposase [Pseudomonas sp. 21]MBV7582701.1 transposase [Pseudomonas sp. PDM33]